MSYSAESWATSAASSTFFSSSADSFSASLSRLLSSSWISFPSTMSFFTSNFELAASTSWWKKGRLPQSLLKAVDMLLDDAILQVVKFTYGTIVLVVQFIIIYLQIFYLFIQLSLQVQTPNLPGSHHFSLFFPTLPFLLPRSSLIL